MKLYDVPRNTRIKIEDQELLFHRIDGMYSICTDSNGSRERELGYDRLA